MSQSATTSSGQAPKSCLHKAGPPRRLSSLDDALSRGSSGSFYSRRDSHTSHVSFAEVASHKSIDTREILIDGDDWESPDVAEEFDAKDVCLLVPEPDSILTHYDVDPKRVCEYIATLMSSVAWQKALAGDLSQSDTNEETKPMPLPQQSDAPAPWTDFWTDLWRERVGGSMEAKQSGDINTDSEGNLQIPSDCDLPLEERPQRVLQMVARLLESGRMRMDLYEV